MRWGGNPKRFGSRPTQDRRTRVLPRRGPPVSVKRNPRWCPKEEKARGIIEGNFREALCQEAPKGRPMIPRPQTRSSQGTTPAEANSQKATPKHQQDPRSSPSGEVSASESRVHSNQQMSGEQAVSARSRIEQLSSFLKRIRGGL